jgi:predicted nucleic acid-binding protein
VETVHGNEEKGKEALEPLSFRVNVRSPRTDLIRAYIDSDVIINYCWVTFFSHQKTKESKSVLLVNKGAMGQFDMHISFYTLMEVSQHFTQYFLQQKAIKEGYTYQESFRQRYKFDLEEAEAKTVFELVENLRNNPYLTYIDVEKMQDRFFPVIKQYLEGSIEFVDAYHLRTAIEVKCQYLVTKDAGFRRHAQMLKTNGVIKEPIDITSESGFLKILGEMRKL